MADCSSASVIAIIGWLGAFWGLQRLLELRCGYMGGPTKTPQVRVPAPSPTRIPRTIRHYAVHVGTAASMASLALDKPLCRRSGLAKFTAPTGPRRDRTPVNRQVSG